MIVFSPGTSLGDRSLGGVLRAKWAEDRGILLRMIERRKRRDVPLDDGDGVMVDPGEYGGDEELDSVEFEPVALSIGDIQYHQMEIENASIGDDRVAAMVKERTAAMAFLDVATKRVEVMAVDGSALVMRAPYDATAVEILGGNLLIAPLTTAALWLQSVRGEQKKTSGLWAQRTSATPPMTAISAQQSNGSSRDATAAA